MPKRRSAHSRSGQKRKKIEKGQAKSEKGKVKRKGQRAKGLCACCGQPMLKEGRDPLSVCVDHNHACCPGGKSCGECIRGLIHWRCNMVLGYAKDNLTILRCAIEYLERWGQQQQLMRDSDAVPFMGQGKRV